MTKQRLDIKDRARELMVNCPAPDYSKQKLIDHIDILDRLGKIRHQLMREFECHNSVARNAIADVLRERRRIPSPPPSR